VAKRKGECVHNHFGHRPDCPKRLLDTQAVPTITVSDPRRVGKFRKADLATARPRTCYSGDHHQIVVEQLFDVEILRIFKLAEGFDDAREN
jgi:hypothetical protein